MIELSLNEVEQLAIKVGRGAGYGWGLSEDAGRAARALASFGFPWAEALLALAAFRARGEARALCPLLTAARLGDDPEAWTAPLTLRDVGAPLWLAGGLAAARLDGALSIAWSNAALRVAGRTLAPVSPDGEWLAASADVTVAPTTPPREPPPPARRPRADEAVLVALGAIAERVYVPASETSRARGAGGGRVDDD